MMLGAPPPSLRPVTDDPSHDEHGNEGAMATTTSSIASAVLAWKAPPSKMHISQKNGWTSTGMPKRENRIMWRVDSRETAIARPGGFLMDAFRPYMRGKPVFSFIKVANP